MATLGNEPQNFLGAKWVQWFLSRAPNSRKRNWALRVVSMSPHYFIDQDRLGILDVANSTYLDKLSNRLTKSRQEIFDRLLKQHLKASFKVIDYGCGPGYLAKAAAPHVNHIYAVDISRGALTCAKIINAAENVEYICTDRSGLNSIPDGSVDAVYSFAVVQHLNEKMIEKILANCRQKLKHYGLLILHIQLPDYIWREQKDWERDETIKGRLKHKYGLHCFGRREEEYFELARKNGFGDIHVQEIVSKFPHENSSWSSQRILLARAINNNAAAPS